MNSLILVFSFIIFISSVSFVLPDINAQEEICNWQIPEEFLILDDKNSKNYFSIPSNEFSLDYIECDFFHETNLKKHLIVFEFFVNSDKNYSMILSLVDSNGNSASTKSISDWYGIPPNSIANIVIDPSDLKPNSNKFSIKDVVKLSLEFSDTVKSVNLSTVSLQEIQDVENYSRFDFLPVQSIIPGFALLLVISFPAGFVLVYFARFFNKLNFFVKLPWIFCFGFFSYISFIYIIGLFELTADTVLLYVIFEYVIFTIFVLKQSLFKIKKLNFNFPGLFFIFLLISSAIFSVSTIGFTGWPISGNDGQGHSILTSLTMYHNQVWDGTSYFPIKDIPPEFTKSWAWYPKGFHTASAGIGLLSNTFPAVALSTTFSFMVFLIPVLLSSLVYRFSNSIFYSSLMFLIVFWRPGDPSMSAMAGDLFWDNWLIGLLSNQVGLIALISAIMVFMEIFQKNPYKLRLIAILSLVFVTAVLSYYPFLALTILIGLFCFIPYYIRNRYRIAAASSSLIIFVALFPIWFSKISDLLSNKVIIETNNLTPYWKYIATQPFDFTGPLFPFWASTIVAVIGTFFLIQIKPYRFLSIAILVMSVIHLLAINEYLYTEHFSFNGNLRSLSLMFYFSIILNLLIVQKIANRFKEKNIFKFFIQKYRIHLKLLIIVLTIVLLVPSFNHMYSDITNIYRIDKVPAGNEYDLLLWLYKNTDRDDLILNDHSHSSFYYTGFRSQKLVNMHFDIGMISSFYDPVTKKFYPKYESGENTIKANEIFKNPWDYQYVSKTLKELNIQYIFLSERKTIHQMCRTGEESCYPDSANWKWRGYSGESRIGMYENNPNLELVIRNGNSAVFKVI